MCLRQPAIMHTCTKWLLLDRARPPDLKGGLSDLLPCCSVKNTFKTPQTKRYMLCSVRLIMQNASADHDGIPHGMRCWNVLIAECIGASCVHAASK